MSARSGYFQGKRGSAALPFFLVLPLRLRSPCRFVRRCHASSGVGCRMCRRRTCALRPSPRPRDSRATALGSSEISSCSAAVLPVVRFRGCPGAGRSCGTYPSGGLCPPQPAESGPPAVRRRCFGAPPRPGPAGVLRLRSLSGMFFRHRLRASAPTTGRATGKKPSDRRKRGNNGGPTGKSARRMRFFQRGSCSKRKKIVFLFVKTDVIPRRKC